MSLDYYELTAPAATAEAENRTGAENRGGARRMSLHDLVFLALGGVIGSGWLFAGGQVAQNTGSWAVLSWLIGGALMLLITVVMVELRAVVPRVGRFMLLPLQSSGPVLATAAAAGVWVCYAVTTVSEVVAMVYGIVEATGSQGLVNSHGTGLTLRGVGLAVGFLVLITAVNLLGRGTFRRINKWLTLFKIAVPVLIVVLLSYALIHPPGPVSVALRGQSGSAPHYDLGSVLPTIVGSGVIFAYLGFQGPLDFAGKVRRDGRDETARVRWVVYGTVFSSILLYAALQVVVVYLRHRTGGPASGTASPYPQFVRLVAPGWSVGPLNWLIGLDMVLSPAGTAIIFSSLLGSEVAVMSRAHLTHRGLQQLSRSVVRVPAGRLLRGGQLDVYWLILLIDCVLSVLLLLIFGGNLDVLSGIAAVTGLIVYAVPTVALAALRRSGLYQGRISVSWWQRALPATVFVAISVIFYLGGWDQLWPAMTALTVGCLVLFGLPVVAAGARWYDANVYANQFLKLKSSPSAGSAVVLFGFFAVTTLASLLDKYAWPAYPGYQIASAVPVAILAFVSFHWTVRFSTDYMRENFPMLGIGGDRGGQERADEPSPDPGRPRRSRPLSRPRSPTSAPFLHGFAEGLGATFDVFGVSGRIMPTAADFEFELARDAHAMVVALGLQAEDENEGEDGGAEQ